MMVLPEKGVLAAEDAGRVFARLFTAADGDRALAYLRAMTLDRAMGAHVSTEQLWHLEGQRYLARYILKLVERGRASD
ncbi:MAG: hypothetical protein JXQ84_07925 [Rhodospirillaceae bacterium]|nr:hypothetical protein [Rhodospirillaceae bacterium]